MDDHALVKALIEARLISEDQGAAFLRESQARAMRAEDIIHERQAVEDEAVAQAKSKLLNIPYAKVSLEKITADLIALIPEESVTTYKVAPIGREANMLIVGMVRPDDVKAQDALRFIAKQNRLSLGIYIITPADLELVERKYSPF